MTPTAIRSCIALGNSSAMASAWIFARAMSAGEEPYSVSGRWRALSSISVYSARTAPVSGLMFAGFTGVVDCGSNPDSTSAAAVSISSLEKYCASISVLGMPGRNFIFPSTTTRPTWHAAHEKNTRSMLPGLPNPGRSRSQLSSCSVARTLASRRLVLRKTRRASSRPS